MNNDVAFKEACFCVVMFVVVVSAFIWMCIASVGFSITSDELSNFRNQAVMRGFAEWESTNHGPVWKWKETHEQKKGINDPEL